LIAAAIADKLISMMVPWTAEQHASMHWRPDAITRTGVIEPMWIRQVSPVDMARHTIDPFINSVRGAGPAVSPYPSPEDVAYVAGKLAQQFARGRAAVVCIGTSKIKVSVSTPPGGGIVGTITAAAQQLARGGTVAIEIGGRRVIVCCSGPGGEPVVQSTAARANGAPKQVMTRETPMTGRQQKSAFGTPPSPNTVLPNVPRPGHVPQFPYIDYGSYYRELTYDPNPWARRTFQATLAQRFAPNAIMAMNAANRSPIQYAQQQSQAPLHSRPPMAQKRLPHPERVYPQQASTSYAVREEQR
jgi:hypothetical protein